MVDHEGRLSFLVLLGSVSGDYNNADGVETGRTVSGVGVIPWINEDGCSDFIIGLIDSLVKRSVVWFIL
jgi:hypothetical protein